MTMRFAIDIAIETSIWILQDTRRMTYRGNKRKTRGLYIKLMSARHRYQYGCSSYRHDRAQTGNPDAQPGELK